MVVDSLKDLALAKLAVPPSNLPYLFYTFFQSRPYKKLNIYISSSIAANAASLTFLHSPLRYGNFPFISTLFSKYANVNEALKIKAIAFIIRYNSIITRTEVSSLKNSISFSKIHRHFFNNDLSHDLASIFSRRELIHRFTTSSKSKCSLSTVYLDHLLFPNNTTFTINAANLIKLYIRIRIMTNNLYSIITSAPIEISYISISLPYTSKTWDYAEISTFLDNDLSNLPRIPLLSPFHNNRLLLSLRQIILSSNHPITNASLNFPTKFSFTIQLRFII